MIRAAVVFAALVLLAAAGAAVEVGAHRARHRFACWRSGRRRVRAWDRIRRAQAARTVGATTDDLATCTAIWNLTTTRREDTP